MFKKLSITIASAFLLLSPIKVFADAQPGDVIVILGENLTPQQKESVLKELTPPSDALTVTVSNAEEHKYLDKYVSKAQIGTKSISSGTITLGEAGSGISLTTNNINWVTQEMYINALITAGVKDAKIAITSPVSVSGTAALTGLMKAYEVSTDTVIPEEQKQVANQEMVTTAKLADQIGQEKTTTLMTNIKEEMAKQKPQTTEEVEALVQNVADQSNVTLNDSQKEVVVELYDRMKDMNIDWGQVKDQLGNAKEKFQNYINSEEGQSFLQKVKEVFVSLYDFITGLFKKDDTAA